MTPPWPPLSCRHRGTWADCLLPPTSPRHTSSSASLPPPSLPVPSQGPALHGRGITHGDPIESTRNPEEKKEPCPHSWEGKALGTVDGPPDQHEIQTKLTQQKWLCLHRQVWAASRDGASPLVSSGLSGVSLDLWAAQARPLPHWQWPALDVCHLCCSHQGRAWSLGLHYTFPLHQDIQSAGKWRRKTPARVPYIIGWAWTTALHIVLNRSCLYPSWNLEITSAWVCFWQICCSEEIPASPDRLCEQLACGAVSMGTLLSTVWLGPCAQGTKQIGTQGLGRSVLQSRESQASAV